MEDLEFKKRIEELQKQLTDVGFSDEGNYINKEQDEQLTVNERLKELDAKEKDII